VWRYYLVPAFVSVQPSGQTWRQPQYVKGRALPTGLNVPWGALAWGADDQFLLGAEVTAADHLALTAHADVTAFPMDDDTRLSTADQAAVTAFANTMGLPASWVTGGETGRHLARSFAGIALVLQRFKGRARMPVTDQLTATVRSLTQAHRDALLAVADDLGLSRDGITADSTIGDLVIAWGRQYTAKDTIMSGRTL
jgi:hypothetical protein